MLPIISWNAIVQFYGNPRPFLSEHFGCFRPSPYEGRHRIAGLSGVVFGNYYRLEEEEIYDSVCDGKNDKGIDGIYVNEPLRQIDIFQTTISKKEEMTLGDAKLKQFTGAISQLSTAENAASVFASANPELQAIANRMDLLGRIENGFNVRGVFVTNAEPDSSATTYLATQDNIILYHGKRLLREFVRPDKTDPIADEASFDISGLPSLSLPIGSDLKMVIAPILANELVEMSGISNGELFAWNVRQWLGRKTAVNRSVAETIWRPDEHKFFPAFHNGVTILCKQLDADNEKIKISGYAVVNGCQSITSLFENQNHITSDLRILTKFIEVSPESDLAAKITDHTNNQNGVTARDRQSNSLVQTRLQAEIHRAYPDLKYRIKRGEHPEWPKGSVIENELLARIFLAFDLKRPEAWSQNYKLFDDLHGDIFARKEVNADRAIFLYDAYHVVMEKLELLEDQLFAQYVLTRWLVISLLREALITDEFGKRLYANPSTFLAEPTGRARLQECIAHVVLSLVRLLDAAIKRQKADQKYFDYKRDLKNREYVTGITAQIIPIYQITVDSQHTESFSAKWAATS